MPPPRETLRPKAAGAAGFEKSIEPVKVSSNISTNRL